MMGRFVRTLRDDFDTGGGVATATPLKTAVEKTVEQLAAERHQRRQKIRDRLTAEDAANFRYRRALDDLAEHEARTQGMSQAYRKKVEPLENELAELEQCQMQNRTDESLSTRRSDLHGELLRLKSARAHQVEVFRQEHDRLDEAQIKAAMRVPTGTRATEDDLFADGDKKLLAIHELAKHDADAAIARLDLLQAPILRTPRAEIEAQVELVESLTAARREAYNDVINE